ncbi:MAG TPA: hypothetical protein DEB12_02600 [Porphyromonadaceae bacterium]|nr:hypothetical protein [Porphyromonadaceae bacterium]
MKNVVSNIDMGYSIPNLKRLVNVIAHIFSIESEIFIMPLRMKELDENSYVVSSINSFIIYVNELYLRKDKVSDFVIRMIIHEMWHVKQMIDKLLSFNQEHTKAYWNGNEYTSDLSHDEREWEKEARQAEQKYFKQIKTLYYDNKEN